MTFEQFVKKNAKRITRLETELNKLFDGTTVYTSIKICQDTHRSSPSLDQTIHTWVGSAERWYFLEKFSNMTAMIGQIKHDVKEARK